MRKFLAFTLAALILAGLAGAQLTAQVPKPALPVNNGMTTPTQLAGIMSGGKTGDGALVFNIGASLLGGKYGENWVTDTISAGVLTLNASVPVHVVSNNLAITSVVITNADTTAGHVNSFVIVFVSTGCTGCTLPAWGGSIQMPNGLPPTLSTTVGAKNPLGLWSVDGGSSWMMVIGATY